MQATTSDDQSTSSSLKQGLLESHGKWVDSNKAGMSV